MVAIPVFIPYSRVKALTVWVLYIESVLSSKRTDVLLGTNNVWRGWCRKVRGKREMVRGHWLCVIVEGYAKRKCNKKIHTGSHGARSSSDRPKEWITLLQTAFLSQIWDYKAPEAPLHIKTLVKLFEYTGSVLILIWWVHTAMIKILNCGKNSILQRFFSVVHVARGDSRILALGAWAPYKTCE